MPPTENMLYRMPDNEIICRACLLDVRNVALEDPHEVLQVALDKIFDKKP
jgi:hypothetical protein